MHRTLFLLLATAVFARELPEVANKPLVALKRQLVKEEVVPLVVDGKWEPFDFDAVSVPATPTFIMNVTDLVLITVADSYCQGDSFGIYLNEHYAISTPRVNISGFCESAPPDLTSLPNSGWSSKQFETFGLSLPITIIPEVSPYGSGRAFIRADSVLKRCNYDQRPHILVTSPLLKHSDAMRNCRRIDGTLGDVTSRNMHAISNVLSNCLGVDQPVWFGRLLPLKRSDTSLPIIGEATADRACPALLLNSEGILTAVFQPCNAQLPTLCRGNYTTP